jgi:hypothetical protein
MIGWTVGFGSNIVWDWSRLRISQAESDLHMLIIGALAIGVVSLIGRAPVMLTPDAIKVGKGFKQVIAWSDVRLIDIERRSFGNRRVVIYEISGRRTVLNAPITGFLFWDRRFEEKFHTIGGWYLEHRTLPGAAGPEDAIPEGYGINDAIPLDH